MPHATFIRDLNDRQKLWALSEPYTYPHDHDTISLTNITHVVTSIALPLVRQIQGCDECYIFASDPEGNVTNWLELPGSQKMTTDHALVLTDMGYPPKDPE